MEKPRILLLNASTNEDGHSREILRLCEEELSGLGCETELFWIGPHHISSCRICGACRETRACVVDDVVPEFTELAKRADGFIVAIPQQRIKSEASIASFASRCIYSAGEVFRLKPAVCVTAALRTGDSLGRKRMTKCFTDAEVPLVSALYWNVRSSDEGARALRKDLANVNALYNAVRDMVYFVRCRQAGREAGVAEPERAGSAFSLPRSY